tara:strand:- start:12691 stop:13836 length:1146 start_codon:yes stop_codon:yes gene_type:complete
MPETTEGIDFDENGICRACNSSEQKMHINWEERAKSLERILEEAKAEAKKRNSPYDCMVPISGGKDSAYQLHVLTKVYKLNVLAVTFSHNWYSKIGTYNLLNCLEEFDVDHIQYTPARSKVNRAAKKSLDAIGDACWHCHSGVGAFPLHIATKFNISLLIWGESIAEMSGRASHFEPVLKFDRDYFLKVSAKVSVKDLSDQELKYREIQMFEPPTAKECEEAGVWGIHLGDYIFWDEEKQTEFLKKNYGWIEDKVENTYKGYKSVECIMPGVHDFTNYIKRGFGRGTVHASMDVRTGLMNREEGLKIAKEFDSEEPNALNYYLEATGHSKEEFYKIMLEKRMIPIKDITPEISESKHQGKNIRPFVIDFIEETRKEAHEEN